jgi:hypothetical protein
MVWSSAGAHFDASGTLDGLPFVLPSFSDDAAGTRLLGGLVDSAGAAAGVSSC